MVKFIPMMKTRKFMNVCVIVVVAVVISILGYSMYSAHSTISSLQSELNSKNELIKSQDSLIHSDTQLIAQRDAELIQSSITIQLLKQDYQQLSVVKLNDLKKYLEDKRIASEFQNGWTITYYSLNTESTGKRPGQSGYGLTASGTRVQDGITIACPPQISLGTKIEITGVGIRTCQDRGGAVKGKTIDVYLPNKSYRQLMTLGRRPVKIHILDNM